MARPFVTVRKQCEYPPSYGIDLGAAGYRLTFDRQIPEQPDYLRACLGEGLMTYLTADTDSFPGVDWNAVRANPWDDGLYRSQVEASIADYQDRYDGLLSYLNVWNEWNDPGTEGSRMPAMVVNEVTRLWRTYFPNHPRLVAASDVSGDPMAFAELDLAPCDMLDTHLWGKSPSSWPDPMTGRLADTARAYQAFWPGYPLCISEIGYSSTEVAPGADGEGDQGRYCGDGMAELVQLPGLEMVGWYAMQDWRGMGLLREDWSKKPSYYYFRVGSQYWNGDREIIRPDTDGDDDFAYAMSFADVNRLHPGLLGAPLENEVTVVPGLATQRTEHGDLTYARVVDQGEWVTFTRRADGYRGRWTVEDLRA